MAKNNNLTDFLTGVATAIREKKEYPEIQKINPQDFESEITGISTSKPEQTKEVTITENGTTEITPDSGKVLTKVTAVVNVASGAALNIAYGDTPPEDTSKLWIKSAEPESIEFAKELEQQVQGSVLSAALPTAAAGIAAAAVGTKIYLFGGDRLSGYLNTIQEFDTETKIITTLSTTLPRGVYGTGAAAVGTKIYLFGGYNSRGLIQEFDTETKTVTTLSATLAYDDTYYMGTAAVGTKIFLFGGRTGGYQKTIQEFDTETKTLTTLSATLPAVAFGMGTAAVGTKIYLFGGSGNSDLDTIQEFDTETKTITTLSATLEKAAYGMGAAAVGTKIYLFGGTSSDSDLDTIQEFDTETKTITTLSATLEQKMYYIAAAAVGTKICVFGGYNSSGSRLNTIQQFIVNFILTANNILAQEDFDNNIFTLLPAPTKVEIGVKNVYKGNASNVAEFVDAYLHNGTNWVNINTGEVLKTAYNVSGQGSFYSDEGAGQFFKIYTNSGDIVVYDDESYSENNPTFATNVKTVQFEIGCHGGYPELTRTTYTLSSAKLGMSISYTNGTFEDTSVTSETYTLTEDIDDIVMTLTEYSG